MDDGGSHGRKLGRRHAGYGKARANLPGVHIEQRMVKCYLYQQRLDNLILKTTTHTPWIADI